MKIITDPDFKSPFTWGIRKYRGNKFYAVATVNGEKLLMHRFIMGCVKGDNKIIDHINGNGLDNRKENLRICTSSQNGMNQNIWKKKKTSKYKGVNLLNGRWRSGIKFKGKKINLGTFGTEKEAALIYDRKAKELFGPFAKTNF